MSAVHTLSARLGVRSACLAVSARLDVSARFGVTPPLPKRLMTTKDDAVVAARLGEDAQQEGAHLLAVDGGGSLVRGLVHRAARPTSERGRGSSDWPGPTLARATQCRAVHGALGLCGLLSLAPGTVEAQVSRSPLKTFAIQSQCFRGSLIRLARFLFFVP